MPAGDLAAVVELDTGSSGIEDPRARPVDGSGRAANPAQSPRPTQSDIDDHDDAGDHRDRATTGSASDVATTTVTLGATVDPGGLPTTYWFEYGTDRLPTGTETASASVSRIDLRRR